MGHSRQIAAFLVTFSTEPEPEALSGSFPPLSQSEAVVTWLKDVTSSLALFMLIAVLGFNLGEVPEQAAYYPRALLTLLGGLVVLLLINTFRKHYKKITPTAAHLAPDGEASGEVQKIGLGTVLVIGLSLLYLLAMPYLGFIIASLLLLVVFMLALGVRSLPTLILVPIVEVGLIWFVFERLLAVLLPNADALRALLGIS